MSIAEFRINEKDKQIIIKIKDHNITYIDNIDRKEKDFYKKIKIHMEIKFTKRNKIKNM
jgi:hypothetical protein